MIYILIPVYNEAENLPLLYKNLSVVKADHNLHFVIVDDCSKDKSVELCHQLFRDTAYTILTKEVNGGPGDSFNMGFNWILENSKTDDLVVTIEADNTSDLGILPEMLAMQSFGYNLVLASVYAQGGGFSKTSFFRKLISFIANMFFRAVYDVKILTLSSFYRIYSVDLLRRIKEKYGIIIKERGFICMLEMLLKAISVNARVIEIPMVLRSDKRIGKSKMKILKTTKTYLRFLLTFRVKR